MKEVEKWKSSLMTMPDASFFELLRTVFGKIKTPFNKQQLLQDLEKFLLQPDIQKTISTFIDNNDEKIIAAVGLFGEPTPDQLERFFEDEFSYMQLHDIIVNLEERFILYRSETRLALNPVLEKVLAPIAANVSLLFPYTASAPKTKHPAANKQAGRLNDRVLAGLFSFVSEHEGTSFYKKERHLRKQILDAGKTCFPGFNLEELFGAFQVLGLFHAEEDKLVPDEARFANIASLSARERMEYCAAGLIVYKETGCPIEIQAPYYKNRIKEAVNFIHSLIDSLLLIQPSTDHYSEKTIIKLAEVLKSRTGYTVNTNSLLEALTKTDLINCSLLIANCSLPSIAIDSGFSILAYPEISFSDAMELASFLNIKEAGAVVRFELEKSCAVRAFNNGISAQNIIDSLTRLSCKKLPDTLEWNLKDWENRHGEVSLKKGVVLTLAKDKRYLAETAPLSALISETLASGVYLLNEGTEEAAAGALQNAGIDIINRGIKSTAQNKNISTAYFSSPFVTTDVFPKKTSAKIKVREASSIKDRQSLIKEFYAILEKMPLSKTDRDELSARIDRRLILNPVQLKDANIRYEKLEARHMDYIGKQNIAKQAIAQGSPVEVVRSENKKEKSIYGIPLSLEKEGTDLILVVTPIGKDAAVRIPLAKISLLRRIKKSIFEG